MLAQVEELQEQDFEEAKALIDQCMRPDSDLSMAEDFPLLVGRRAQSRRLVIRIDNKIVSHVAGRTVPAQLPNGRQIHCLNLGAVCTDSAATGQGFARQLLEEQMSRAQSEGVALAMLWSEVEGFYEKFGFEYAGLETRFLVSRSDLSRVPVVEAHWLTPRDIPRLLRLRNMDPCPLIRTDMEARILFSLPRSRTLVATCDGEVVAYLTFGKGLDFEGAICEWAGDMHYVLGLTRVLLELEQVETALVVGPGWHDAFIKTFTALGCVSEEADLAMFCPLDPGAISSAVESLRSSPSPIPPAQVLGQVLGKRASPGDRPILPFYVWGLDSM